MEERTVILAQNLAYKNNLKIRLCGVDRLIHKI